MRPILFIFISLILSSCQKPDRINPWDQGAPFDSLTIAPFNTSLQHIALTKKKITWELKGTLSIEGFQIDRKQGNEPWWNAMAKLSPESREWTDTLVLPIDLLKYQYRIYSFIDSRKSSADTISFSASSLPPVENLLLVKTSEKQMNLSWSYSGDSEDGFLIDRKLGSASWQTAFASLPSSSRSFVDTNVFHVSKQLSIEYAIYPVFKTITGNKSFISSNASINAPSNLTFVPGSGTELHLKWLDNSVSESGFRIDKLRHSSEWVINYTLLPVNKTDFIDPYCDLSNNVYTYRIYAFNDTDVSSYTEATIGKPGIITFQPSTITYNSVASGGDVLSENGQPVSKRGLCWSTTPNPTLSDFYSDNGAGVGTFAAVVSGLSPATHYYMRAYATNIAGTSFGNEIQFTTSAGQLPSLSTTAAYNITQISAFSGGTISNTGSTPVTSRGVCWSTSPNPTLSSNHTIDGSGSGVFTSQLTNLSPGTTYYIRAFATNAAGTAYGNLQQFSTGVYNPPTVTTLPITNIGLTTATGGGNVVDQGSFPVTARGICWDTTPSPDLFNNFSSNGTGVGTFMGEMINLIPGTTYYVRAYAINSFGTSYGNEIQFVTLFAAEVLNPSTGKWWLDRNLGAIRVAQNSNDEQAFGDLYQWGRCSDGHEKRSSNVTTILSNTDLPGHGKFILVSQYPYDWRNPQNNDLWQDMSGTNNPCPSGFRLPTLSEWDIERQSWSSNNAAGAINSPLKIPLAGYRNENEGSIMYNNTQSILWSSTILGSNARGLQITFNSAFVITSSRATGYTIRCIKD